MTLIKGSGLISTIPNLEKIINPVVTFSILVTNMMTWSTIVTCVLLFMITWLLYIVYINKSAEDKSAPREIANLPIPPGSYGLPVIGEVISKLLNVSLLF